MIKLACDLRFYKTLHGSYCRWESIQWKGLSYENVDSVYVHINSTKYIIKIEKRLRKL